MKKAAPKGNNQRNTKENGYRITWAKRKQGHAVNLSSLEDIKTNGVKGVGKNNAVQRRKKSAGFKLMNKAVGNTSGNGTSTKKACEKSNEVAGVLKKAAKHNPTPKTTSLDNNHLSRKKRNDTRSEEEELVSTTGSSGGVSEKEISDDQEEEEQCDSRKESSEGDSSEEDTESSDIQRNTEQTAINSLDKDSFVESKCSSGLELNTRASSTEEEEEIDLSSGGLKDETQDREVTQEDTSEGLAGCRTHRQHRQPSCTSTSAKETRYKMFKRTKAEKQAEKDEKCRVKAEKQRLEKEAKQKAKEEKKNKKKQLKAEKHASVTKEIQSMGITLRKDKITNKSLEKAKNTKKEACRKVNMSEVSGKEDGEEEPALTKAVKDHQIVHLKEKGKDLRNILVKPKGDISEGEPLVLDSNKVSQCLITRRKGATTFDRMSGWIQNMPQKINFGKKLSAWTKAMGISCWLSSKVMKQSRIPKKSKSSILKHRMALRVASKSVVSKSKMAKEKAEEGGDDVPGGEKDTEAKYAVVLPRMNELGKLKAVELSQVTPLSSAPESKPPKAGSRLVLPVKPDLSLLKSIKKPLPGDLSPRGDLSRRITDSSQVPESSLNMGEQNRNAPLENQDGISVLQAARRKLDPSQVNLTKMFLSGRTIRPIRARGLERERDAGVGIPRSNAQPFPNGDGGMGVLSSRPICDEETDREVAQLMCEGGIYGINQSEVHWSGNPQMSGDPQVRSGGQSKKDSLCNMCGGQPFACVWFRTGCVLRIFCPTKQWRSSATGQSMMMGVKQKMLLPTTVEGHGSQKTLPKRCWRVDSSAQRY